MKFILSLRSESKIKIIQIREKGHDLNDCTRLFNEDDIGIGIINYNKAELKKKLDFGRWIVERRKTGQEIITDNRKGRTILKSMKYVRKWSSI